MRSFVIGKLYEGERVDFKRGRNLGGRQYPAFRMVGLATRFSALSTLRCRANVRWRHSE
jgi:hypothetical protein